MHLIHSTTTPLNETLRAYKQALQQQFAQQLHQCSIDPLDITKTKTQTMLKLLPQRFKKIVQPITEHLNNNDWLVCTDWATPLLIKHPKLIHIISELPPAWLEKNYQKRCSNWLIVVPSHYLKGQLQEHGINTTIEVIPPPLSTKLTPEEKRSSKQNSFLVGVVAPLEQQQGLETVIQAFQRNQELLPFLRVIFVGDGSERKRLLWLIEQLHLKRKIQIVSHQQDYQRFLFNFDVYIAPNIQPSAWNPVLIQALAQGIPVIASQIEVHAEIIEPGKTGLLFEPGNSHVLAQHMLNLYNHPEWREHYKKSGPAFVQDLCSADKFYSKFQALLA